MLWLGTIMFITANVVGAFLTWKLKMNAVPSWSMYALLPFSTTAWIMLVRSKVPLTTLSVFADVGVCLIYLIVFLALGERMTAVQFFGAALAIVGIALMT